MTENGEIFSFFQNILHISVILRMKDKKDNNPIR